MGGNLCVFFRGRTRTKEREAWIADGIFQRLISCRIEADRETVEDRGPQLTRAAGQNLSKTAHSFCRVGSANGAVKRLS